VLLYQEGLINAISDIYSQGYKPCYIELLEKFQVRANMVAHLLNGGALTKGDRAMGINLCSSM
jgi:hypothetical protein